MRLMVVFLVLPALFVGQPGVRAENWPQWRGPLANGVSTETGLPESWGEGRNIHWKIPLQVRGHSTPIVWGERIFVTGQKGEGPIEMRALGPGAEEAQPSGRPRFYIQCFHISDGRLLWEYSFDARAELTPVHPKHNLASPSAVTDGEHVYAWFGSGRLLCLSMEGKLAWERRLDADYGPFKLLWAHGSSPVLYQGSVILQCDHTPGAYLLALDKKDGRTLWKTDRDKGIRAYSTPLVVSRPEGDELVLNSQNRVDAYDPRTGEHLWQAGGRNKVPVPSPILAGGMIFINRGYSSSPFLAIRPGGRGDVSRTHVPWRRPSGGPYVSSLLHYQGLLYLATEHGILKAVDPSTGQEVWKERVGGTFSASPLGADGKVYLFNEGGEAVVLKAGRSFQLLSRTDMGERIMASPAVSAGRIYLRTEGHLFSIGRRGE